MPIKVSTLQVITKEDVAVVRKALKDANIKASVRKHNGSMRWTLTVTCGFPDIEMVKGIVCKKGYTFYYTNIYSLDEKAKVRFQNDG